MSTATLLKSVSQVQEQSDYWSAACTSVSLITHETSSMCTSAVQPVYLSADPLRF